MRDISRDQLLDELRALKRRLEDEGVTHATLIGSRARGDNRRDSDIDLVVEIDDTRKFSLLDLIGVGHIIEDRLGPRVDVLTRRSLDQSFLDEIGSDEIELF